MLERTKREFGDERREANGDHNKLEEIFSRERYEVTMCEEDLAELRSDHLVEKARRLGIKPPPKPTSDIYAEDFFDGNDDWDRHRVQCGLSLTRKGEMEMRGAIREEERLRREVAAFWLTTLTGVLGTAAGLVSAFVALAALTLRAPTP